MGDFFKLFIKVRSANSYSNTEQQDLKNKALSENKIYNENLKIDFDVRPTFIICFI